MDNLDIKFLENVADNLVAIKKLKHAIGNEINIDEKCEKGYQRCFCDFTYAASEYTDYIKARNSNISNYLGFDIKGIDEEIFKKLSYNNRQDKTVQEISLLVSDETIDKYINQCNGAMEVIQKELSKENEKEMSAGLKRRLQMRKNRSL